MATDESKNLGPQMDRRRFLALTGATLMPAQVNALSMLSGDPGSLSAILPASKHPAQCLSADTVNALTELEFWICKFEGPILTATGTPEGLEMAVTDNMLHASLNLNHANELGQEVGLRDALKNINLAEVFANSETRQIVEDALVAKRMQWCASRGIKGNEELARNDIRNVTLRYIMGTIKYLKVTSFDTLVENMRAATSGFFQLPIPDGYKLDKDYYTREELQEMRAFVPQGNRLYQDLIDNALKTVPPVATKANITGRFADVRRGQHAFLDPLYSRYEQFAKDEAQRVSHSAVNVDVDLARLEKVRKQKSPPNQGSPQIRLAHDSPNYKTMPDTLANGATDIARLKHEIDSTKCTR